MPPFCIHIGPSKTGTTTLQREIFAKHSEITYLGKPFYSPDVSSDNKKGLKTRLPEDFVLSLRLKDSLEYDEARVIEGVREHIEKYPPDRRVSVLSEEGLAAPGGADRVLIAKRLRRAFGSCNILITIRSQLTCIPSIFLHYYRRGDFVGLTFDGWLRDESQSRQRARVYETWRQYDYYSLYKLYREVFPEGRVKILLFEQMIRDSRAFSEEISEFLGVDVAETQRLFDDARKLNVGVSLEEADFHHKYQSMRSRYGKFKTRYFPGLKLEKLIPFETRIRSYGKRAIEAHYASRNSKASGGARASDESLRMIREHFAESNEELAKECNLPLSEFGYPL